MDAIELLRYQQQVTWKWLDRTVADVTEEQANWQPAGVANSIASTYAHTMIAADEDFNKVMSRGEMLLYTTWKDRCGLSVLPEGGWDWSEWGRTMHMDWDKFRGYADAIRTLVEDWFGRLTPELLESDVDMSQFGLGMWNGLQLFELHVHHPRIHGGEIACLKGLQGAAGWPWGPSPP